MKKIIEDTNEGFDWLPIYRPEDHVFVTYFFRTGLLGLEPIYLLAREHSTSTFNRLSEETKELRTLRATKVYRVGKHTFTLAYPIENFSDIVQFLVTIAGEGNLLNKKVFSSLVITDIKMPDRFLKRFSGPRYGKTLLVSAGVPRDRAGLLGVQKPSIGLSAEVHVRRALDAFRGGCDFVKEDEQLYSQDVANPIEERIRLLSKFLPPLRRKMHKNLMYVFNITSEQMFPVLQKIEKQAGRDKIAYFGVMISLLCGLPLISAVRKQTKLPIFIHSSGLGFYTRGPFGIAPHVFATLLRLIGADCIIYPGPHSKIVENNPKDVRKTKLACDAILSHIKPCLLSLGGGMRKENYQRVRKTVGSDDFLFLVGADIFGSEPMIGAKDFISSMEM